MNFKFLKVTLIGLIITASCLVNVASAGLMTFTDRTAFEAVLSNNTLIDNLNSASIGHISGGYSSSLFSFSKRYYGCELGEDCGVQTPALDGRYQWIYGDQGVYNLTFNQNISAFGFDYADAWENADSYSISINGITSPTSGPSDKFFGIIDSAGLGTNVNITVNGNWLIWDNITVNANPIETVPEPTTLAIFALGMIGLASRRFKKQS